MKLIKIFVGLCLMSSLSFAKICAVGTVESIEVGNSDGDSGNRARVALKITRTDNGQTINSVEKLYFNNLRNMNDPSGKALFALLLTAINTGAEVKLGDDIGDKCDDFNYVKLHAK